MFCSQCGTKLPDNSKFCNQCGSPVRSYQQSNIIRLRCEDCNGVMEIDESREVISCPYCGSKKIVLESDGVKIEKIRSASKYERKKIDRDIEQIRADRDVKVAKYKKDPETQQHKYALIGALGCFIIAALLILFGF